MYEDVKSSRHAAFYSKTLVAKSHTTVSPAWPAASPAAGSATVYSVDNAPISAIAPSAATASNPTAAGSRLPVDASNNMTITYTYKSQTHTVRARADMPASMLYLLFSGIVHRPFSIIVNGTVLSRTSTDTVQTVLKDDATVVIEHETPESIQLKQFQGNAALKDIPLETDKFKAFCIKLQSSETQAEKDAVSLLFETLKVNLLDEALAKLQEIALGSRPIGWGANGCVFCPAVAVFRYDTDLHVSKLFESIEWANNELRRSNAISFLDKLETFRFTAKPIGVYRVVEDNVPFEYYAKKCGKSLSGHSDDGVVRNLPKCQLLSEYGGVSFQTMINLMGTDVRALAIALYPLFFGQAIMHQKSQYLSDLSIGNVLYNVVTQRCVFIDYAEITYEMGKPSIQDLNNKFKGFIRIIVKPALYEMYPDDATRHSLLYYKLIQGMFDIPLESSPLEALEALPKYAQFLYDQYQYEVVDLPGVTLRK